MELQKISKSFPAGNGLRFLAIIIAGLAFALLKLNGTPIDQTLWAEDGPVFINQAHEFGALSIFIPYNGYFHFYPRLIAWLSCLIDLSLTPPVFFAAWLLAYIALVCVVTNRALRFCISYAEIGILVLLMLAQPHSSEVFFTLTNSQWLIGCALAIFLLVPAKDISIWEKIVLLITVLTGPFVLVVTPILLIQLLIYRDWNTRKYVYLLVGLGDLVQITAVFLSNRLADSAFDPNLIHWATACFHFFSFGNATIITTVACIIFWPVSSYALFKSWPRNLVLSHSYNVG